VAVVVLGLEVVVVVVVVNLVMVLNLQKLQNVLVEFEIVKKK
jgi:hypothetical protein